MPSSPISKQPTSSAGPNRFLVARISRKPECRSPSNASTTSTRCSSSRGPAMFPSLVTWPMMITAMPRCLATRIKAAVTSRIWVTPPGEPSASAVPMVCTESTTSSEGRTSSTWPSTVPRSVSAARYSSSASASVRPARSRTWAADSSPVTYRVVRPAFAHCAATSSSSVDLPTPGSPASSTTAPGTRPSPSTRSSSPTPVRTRAAASASTSLIRVARRVGVAALTSASLGAPTSVTLPQA